MRLLKRKRTLYVRNPDNNYQFEKIGEIGFWGSANQHKSIWLDGKLYTLTQITMEDEE